ncbi:MAG: ATP synthase F1 subunit epsilon [Methylobacteriaceae bacterium]|jgi:F-type H+-transporting ATPase subunit epsilon|nr:ATP synthase F1 subunit epsilon [Methylobacteriaceae bacterium]
MATFPFELVSPEKIIFSGAAEAVVLPAEEGEMTVFAGHVPLVAAMKTGLLTITDDKNQKVPMLVFGGFLDVGPANVVVMTERAYSKEQWTPELLAQEIQAATAARDAAADFDRRVVAEENLAFLRQFKI